MPDQEKNLSEYQHSIKSVEEKKFEDGLDELQGRIGSAGITVAVIEENDLPKMYRAVAPPFLEEDKRKGMYWIPSVTVDLTESGLREMENFVKEIETKIQARLEVCQSSEPKKREPRADAIGLTEAREEAPSTELQDLLRELRLIRPDMTPYGKQILSVDRAGWVLDAEFAIHPAWSRLNLDYKEVKSYPPGVDQYRWRGELSFSDDHYRSISEAFSTERARYGRDDRSFGLERRPDIVAYEKYLKQDASRIVRELDHISRSGPVNPKELRYHITHSVRSGGKDYDEQDKEVARPDIVEWSLEWMAEDEGNHRQESLLRVPISSGKSEDVQARVEETMNQAQEALDVAKQKYDEFMHSSDVQTRQHAQEIIQKELENFSGARIDAELVLLAPGTEKNEMVLLEAAAQPENTAEEALGEAAQDILSWSVWNTNDRRDIKLAYARTVVTRRSWGRTMKEQLESEWGIGFQLGNLGRKISNVAARKTKRQLFEGARIIKHVNTSLGQCAIILSEEGRLGFFLNMKLDAEGEETEAAIDPRLVLAASTEAAEKPGKSEIEETPVQETERGETLERLREIHELLPLLAVYKIPENVDKRKTGAMTSALLRAKNLKKRFETTIKKWQDGEPIFARDIAEVNRLVKNASDTSQELARVFGEADSRVDIFTKALKEAELNEYYEAIEDKDALRKALLHRVMEGKMTLANMEAVLEDVFNDF